MLPSSTGRIGKNKEQHRLLLFSIRKEIPYGTMDLFIIP